MGCNSLQVKDIRDFIINETNFTRTSLAQNPWIFLHNLTKIKQRFIELKTFGGSIPNMNILIYSEKNFKAYLNRQRENQQILADAEIENSDSLEPLEIACNSLQKYLPKCNKAEATDLCKSYPNILKIPADKLIVNIKTLVNCNIDKEFIYENPHLLKEEAGTVY